MFKIVKREDLEFQQPPTFWGSRIGPRNCTAKQEEPRYPIPLLERKPRTFRPWTVRWNHGFCQRSSCGCCWTARCGIDPHRSGQECLPGRGSAKLQNFKTVSFSFKFRQIGEIVEHEFQVSVLKTDDRNRTTCAQRQSPALPSSPDSCLPCRSTRSADSAVAGSL